MAMPKTHPKRQPERRSMAPPEPVRRVNTHETASHTVQTAVRAAGGLERVVGLISAGFEGDSPARKSLKATRQAALSELAALNESSPESDRAAPLRTSVQSCSLQLLEVEREIETASRRSAHTLVMNAMGGDPDSIRRLIDHTAKVSPAFVEAVHEANL